MAADKYPKIVIYLQTFKDTSSDVFAHRLFEVLFGSDELLAPQKFGQKAGKLKEYQSLSDLVEYWPNDVEIWKRNKKLKNNGSFNTSTKSSHPTVFRFRSEYSESINWSQKFTDLCSLFEPKLGMLHLFTDEEAKEENSTYKFRQVNFSAAWSPRVPGLGWMFAAGERYYNSIDKPMCENLGVKVSEGKTYVLLQIANSGSEILNNYNSFHNRRAELIEQIPSKFFPELSIAGFPQRNKIF